MNKQYYEVAEVYVKQRIKLDLEKMIKGLEAEGFFICQSDDCFYVMKECEEDA